MSLFKKPNRNFRRREKEIEDEEQDAKGAEIVKSKERNNVKNANPNKAIKQTLLSFGGEFDEGSRE